MCSLKQIFKNRHAKVERELILKPFNDLLNKELHDSYLFELIESVSLKRSCLLISGEKRNLNVTHQILKLSVNRSPDSKLSYHGTESPRIVYYWVGAYVRAVS
jgi:hypothetical protein